MNELSEQLFSVGVEMNKAHAEMFRRAEQQHRIVYLVWQDLRDSNLPVLLGVCGTKDRAHQEAADLGHALGAVLRIEMRAVHV